MGLSPLKRCIREILQNDFHCSHFFEISLFQTKYLAVVICSVSLSIYIFWTSTRISLVFDRLVERCEKVRGPVEQTPGKKTAANIFEYPGERKIFGKYLLREGLDG